MKTISSLSIIFLLFVAASCGQTEKKSELETMKAQLDNYNRQLVDLESKVKALERQIVQADPDFASTLSNYTLVSTIPVVQKKFIHQIQARAIVESRKNIVVSSESMGRITSIKVKEGDAVSEGQVLLTVDAEILKNNIEELKTSMELAKVIYERQENLWQNNIGTEIQYLQAKNNYESLERKLETAKSQLAQSVIRAPFSGHIDEVFIKEGEMAQMGGPVIRIVSLKDMYLKADISESHIGKFKANDPVQVEFPSLNRKFESKITAVGQMIDPSNRTFSLEIKLLNMDALIKPNLTALVSLTDYENPEALVVPTEIIQKDNKGDYVYVVQNGNDGTMATRVHIEIGKSFQNESEILAGLSNTAFVINKGFREVTDGMMVKEVKAN
jgi:RND family efflux transporter MFP subunit